MLLNWVWKIVQVASAAVRGAKMSLDVDISETDGLLLA